VCSPSILFRGFRFIEQLSVGDELAPFQRNKIKRVDKNNLKFIVTGANLMLDRGALAKVALLGKWREGT
jgi:hypothetical protein